MGGGGFGSFGGSLHGSGGSRASFGPSTTSATQQETWDAEFPLLMKFLFERLQIAERTAGRMDATRRSHPNAKTAAPAQTAKPGSGRQGQNSGDGAAGSAKQKPQPSECPVCNKKDHHLISKCPVFLKLSVSQRYNAVRQAKAVLQLLKHVPLCPRVCINVLLQRVWPQGTSHITTLWGQQAISLRFPTREQSRPYTSCCWRSCCWMRCHGSAPSSRQFQFKQRK